MKFISLKLFLITFYYGLLISGCSSQSSELTQEEFLQEHIEWLASDELQGRLAGTVHEAESANYIADNFLQYGVLPAGDRGTYFQQFTLSGPMADVMGVDNHLSRNVVGQIEGSEYPGRYIIIGAHYDGQGRGGMISMSHDKEDVIHNSADDNASGTAGLLYLARELAQNPMRTSVKFVAFSGEELGLQGSRHYVDEMEIQKDSVLAMINLDMIGRLDDGPLLCLVPVRPASGRNCWTISGQTRLQLRELHPVPAVVITPLFMKRECLYYTTFRELMRITTGNRIRLTKLITRACYGFLITR